MDFGGFWEASWEGKSSQLVEKCMKKTTDMRFGGVLEGPETAGGGGEALAGGGFQVPEEVRR